MNLKFKSIHEYRPGIIASLLKQSYADLVLSDREYWEPEEKKWEEFDRDVFQNPDTIGVCVLLSCSGGHLVGFGSFDIRKSPEYGIIGHNCILPVFQGRGFGKEQILEILKRFHSFGIRTARASTSEHPFFLPARRMYLSCGFREKRRIQCEVDPRYKVIEYEKKVG